MKKKAQAAFEFLSSYLWAFLVIVLVAGMLIYFTSDTTKQLPDSCILEGAPCKAFSITGVNCGSGTCDNLDIEFESQNPVFDKIELQGITYEYNNEILSMGVSASIFPANVTSGGLISILRRVNVSVHNINIEKTVNIKIKIPYKIEGEVFTKYLQGEIISKIYD